MSLDDLTEKLDLYTTKCPACGVEITDQGKVLFSHGGPGTKARLRARVCQFAKKSGCINDYEGPLTANDHYTPVETSDYSDFINEILE